MALALAGAWAAAAYWLWRDAVPAGLDLPDVDPRSFLTERQLERADDYERFTRILFLVSQGATLAVLAAYAVWGARFLRESAAGRVGSGMLLAMLGLGFLWFVQLPVGLLDVWWAERYGLGDADYVTWIVETWFTLGWEFLFISVAIVIVMGLAGPLGDHWWIPGGAVFVGLAVLFAFLIPYLLPSQRPLRDAELAAAARRFEAELDLPRTPVRVQEVSEFTDTPNALAAGLGPSRRVILWDTLLDERFEDREVKVVLAHELAHLAREHIWETLGWYALFAFPGAFLVARITRRRGGMREPSAVPLGLFAFVALSLAALPVQNVVSRHLEAEADWVALETTEDPEAAAGLFEAFSTTALADPDPPTWAYLLVESHPTIEQRVAMARAWARRAREP